MKTSLSESNKKYWDKWNIKYSDVWQSRARKEMSKREMSYITSKLINKKPELILDIGIGNGRILNVLSHNSPAKSKIYGIDISKKMVRICQKHFKNDKKIIELAECDLSLQEIPFNIKFDFVTMIRVLKYNSNWREMIKKVYQSMKPKGVYVYTMPNKHSISAFSGDKFSDNNSPIEYTTISELIHLSEKIGFSKIEIVAFSKLPNFLYHINENRLFVSILLSSEKLLEKLLGESFLGRELFITCTK